MVQLHVLQRCGEPVNLVDVFTVTVEDGFDTGNCGEDLDAI